MFPLGGLSPIDLGSTSAFFRETLSPLSCEPFPPETGSRTNAEQTTYRPTSISCRLRKTKSPNRQSTPDSTRTKTAASRRQIRHLLLEVRFACKTYHARL